MYYHCFSLAQHRLHSLSIFASCTFLSTREIGIIPRSYHYRRCWRIFQTLLIILNMYSITEDQEWTLRNWVSTFGEKPGPKEKVFLLSEKGLTEDQIDSWWSKHQGRRWPLYDSRIFLIMHIGFLTECGLLKPSGSSQLQLIDESSLYANLSSDQPSFDSPIILSSGPSMQNTSQDEIFDSSLLGVSVPGHLWSVPDYTQDSTNTSTFTALPNLRAPFIESANDQWTSTCNSNRSSCASHASSTRTWASTSTLLSIPDLFDEDDVASRLSSTHGSSKNQTNRATFGFHNPAEYLKHNISEEDFTCPCPEQVANPPKPPSKKQFTPKSKATAPSKTRLASKSEKSQAPKYKCTACNLALTRKGDWERHEDSKHDPQTYWTCMLGDPAIQTMTGWTCAFCNTSRSCRDDIVEHLKSHKINTCASKPHANRTWTRKDKLKQHLQQVHSLSESAGLWERWQRPASRKGAWGCGFCGACSFTWEGMWLFLSLD